MDGNISFEDFRKKGREKLGLDTEAEEKARRKALVEKMKSEIVKRVNDSTDDDEIKRKILSTTKKFMGNDD